MKPLLPVPQALSEVLEQREEDVPVTVSLGHIEFTTSRTPEAQPWVSSRRTSPSQYAI